METANTTAITVTATIMAPVSKVWKLWNEPEHITQWCNASDDWHAPYAENDLKEGGRFRTTMAAKDGSFSFDFGGVYTTVENNRRIDYTLGDGRKVQVRFEDKGDETKVTETFEMENTHSEEMQRSGWQAILNNFKKHAEQN